MVSPWINIAQAESWECDLNIPDLPVPTTHPGAAVLGQVSLYIFVEINNNFMLKLLYYAIYI